MQATLLDYLNDAYQLEGTAEIVAIQDEEEGKKSIVLKSTLFYPQGGGQPSDQGCLDSEASRFHVHKVRFDQGVVYHIGEFEKGEMKAGEKVVQLVNECQRKVNRINHSAGHLIDVAMLNCGFGFHPTKGYHFPDSPYVEYAGIIEPEQREKARLQLQEEVEQLIGKGGVVNDFVVNDKVALRDH
jgi:Ser-tRNA(Ala) deacylase AlaX